MTELKFMPYAIAWGALLLVVLVLAIIRSKMAGGADDALKLSDSEVAAVSHQQHVAKNLSTVETLGKSLTVLLLASGLLIAGLYGWALFSNPDMFAK